MLTFLVLLLLHMPFKYYPHTHTKKVLPMYCETADSNSQHHPAVFGWDGLLCSVFQWIRFQCPQGLFPVTQPPIYSKNTAICSWIAALISIFMQKMPKWEKSGIIYGPLYLNKTQESWWRCKRILWIKKRSNYISLKEYMNMDMDRETCDAVISTVKYNEI